MNLHKTKSKEIRTKLNPVVKEIITMLGDEPEFKKQAFIAGGAIRSIVLDEQPNDIDFFLRSEKLVNKIINKIGPKGFVTENAVTFHVLGFKCQIIINEFGTPNSTIDKFDFTINQCFYDLKRGQVVVRHLNDIVERRFSVNPKCRNKIGTMVRVLKFTDYGYRLRSRQCLINLSLDIAKIGEVKTFGELVDHSRLYFRDEEIADLKRSRKVKFPRVKKKSFMRRTNNHHGSSF